MLYISLMGLAVIVPMAVGMHPVGEIIALMSLFFVVLFIRSDRKREQSRPGFPVIPKEAPRDETKGDEENPER